MKRYRLEIRNEEHSNLRIPWVDIISPSGLGTVAYSKSVQGAINYVLERAIKIGGLTPQTPLFDLIEIPLELLIRWEKEKSDNLSEKLSDWEIDFLDSVKNRVDRLTSRQQEKLDEIFENAFKDV